MRGTALLGAMAALLLTALPRPGQATLAPDPEPPAAVWRCGEPGRYSDRPCPGGQALALEPAPSETRRREAQRVLQREQALASQLRKERLDAERQRRPMAPAAILDSAGNARRAAEASEAAQRRREAALSRCDAGASRQAPAGRSDGCTFPRAGPASRRTAD